jgi:hypothetical protein
MEDINSMAIMKPAVLRFLQQYLEGNTTGEPVHARSKNRGGLFRLHLESGGNLVVKIWHLRNIKEKCKAAARISNGRREWLMHRLVYEAGIKVPEPLLFLCLTIADFGACELMGIEDIGVTESGVPYLKRLIAAGCEREIIHFEDCLIDITSRLLRLKILDVDNQLNNFLVDGNGRVFRIDFECARRRHLFKLHRVELATMLDRLLRSHLHATYPESERTSQFMTRVSGSLAISADVRQMTAAITSKELIRERSKTGIEYNVDLNW